MLLLTLLILVGDKTERCPKLKVIDVSGTLAEVCLYLRVTWVHGY